MPTIRDILDQKGGDVVIVGPEDTVHRVIEILNERRIGALMVEDAGGAVVGIITERDILRAVQNHSGRLDSARVSEFMTTDLTCGVAEDDLDYVMAMMTESRFRHLPVMEGAALVGIVSIGDVVKALKSAREYENRLLKDYIGGH